MSIEDLIKNHTGLIYKIANQYFYGVEKEDLFQSGVIGLLNAYKNYQKNASVKFSSYAFKYIFGEMYNLAMQKQIKISRDYLKLYHTIEKARYTIVQKKGMFPTNEELSIFLNIPLEELEHALYVGSITVSSLDKSSKEERSFYETIAEEEKMPIEDKIVLLESIEKLNEEERKIIEYRYFEDLTQTEIARKLKKTQVMVSRYEQKAKDKMREYIAS